MNKRFRMKRMNAGGGEMRGRLSLRKARVERQGRARLLPIP